MPIRSLIAAEFLLGLGVPGAIGAVLLLASLGYGAAALWPAQGELSVLRDRVVRAERHAAAVGSGAVAAPSSAASRRQQFNATLPAHAEAMECVERIYAAAAAEQLSLWHGEYTRADLPGAGLVRYRIVLPLQGSYGQIRRFIAAAAGAVPGLALDDLSLQRHNVGEAKLEARVQLSLYLAPR